MSLTPQNERDRESAEPASESKPIYWLLVVLVLGLVVGWLYVQHGDLETAWEEADDWVFWILIVVAWLLPLLAQLLAKGREAAEGSGDARYEEPRDELRDHGMRRVGPSVKRAYKPIRPR